ncbi:Ger(x)C family spore germination protein [Paenibacillus sp. GCM10023250]|uniref:Ger(x)C family spore germination protein n=1 Tax=Paenibacillus sp. GCM10023250 TaxID=3252648 RepID=UPI003621EE21
MRRVVLLLAAVSALLLLPACKDRLNLEDTTLVLMMGMDLDKDNRLVIYSSSPVFSKEAKQSNEVTQVNALTLRDSRGLLDSRVSALISTGKLQNILVGKKLLQQPDWVHLLDVVYRDSKTRNNARLVAVDGSVGDIMYFAPPDKRRLSLHIAKLLDTTNKRNLVEATTLWELHRLLYERGRTPDMGIIRKTEREVVVDKTALLNHGGLYVGSIDTFETTMLQIVQDDKKSSLSVTLVLPEKQKPGTAINTGAVSFYVLDVDRKVRTSFAGGKFRFDIELELPIRLTERLFAFDVGDNAAGLQDQIDEQLKNKMDALVAKLQRYQLDPIGLGLFARAYRYREWKKVQDRWGEAFGQAEVSLRVRTRIVDMGEVR